jgi:hypothetical protein
MESRNATLFEVVFPWKETRENYLLERTIETSSSNHHQLEDDEIELR